MITALSLESGVASISQPRQSAVTAHKYFNPTKASRRDSNSLVRWVWCVYIYSSIGCFLLRTSGKFKDKFQHSKLLRVYMAFHSIDKEVVIYL